MIQSQENDSFPMKKAKPVHYQHQLPQELLLPWERANFLPNGKVRDFKSKE